MTETTERQPFRVRNSTEADIAFIQRIYEPEVLSGFASFEETPPSVEEMARRRREALALGLPYIVAERHGAILGYAYAASYRARPAYRWTIEDSVYVAREAQGQGVGSGLLSELVACCEAGPWRQMIAVIGDSGNLGSIALHARLGFQPAGRLENVGFKFGRWIDSVLMQRPLGAGAETPPS